MRRIRRGRGFSYVDGDGRRVKSSDELARIRDLVIPPAWEDVWICPDPYGHLQATGVDAAGRRQYLYHPRWREHRDRAKFEKMLRFADLLPGLRRRLALPATCKRHSKHDRRSDARNIASARPDVVSKRAESIDRAQGHLRASSHERTLAGPRSAKGRRLRPARVAFKSGPILAAMSNNAGLWRKFFAVGQR